MCKKPNPRHDDFHQSAKNVVPELSKEVLTFNQKGKHKETANYLPLAQKLIKYGYSIKTFLKYWNGKKLTTEMISSLEDAIKIIKGEQEPVSKSEVMTKKEVSSITQ